MKSKSGLLLLSFLTVFTVNAMAQDEGTRDSYKPVKWLQEIETYGLWYGDLASPKNMERYKGLPLVIWGQPASNLKWIPELHELGVRSIAYVSFYKAPKMPEVEDRRGWQGGSPGIKEVQKNPFWLAVDRSEHPEWTLIAEDGSVERPFGKPDYAPGWDQVCTNVRGYREAAIDGVKKLLELGFDGLFIDNVHPQNCYGPEHRMHDHVDPDKSNQDTYRMLLAEVRRVVKSYGDDKVCILNAGDPDKDFAQYGDGMMWESYLFEGQERRHSWSTILQAAGAWESYLGQGKAILALSTIQAEEQGSRKEKAFYAYACAKLSGFQWAANYQFFDKVRIGAPVSGMQIEDGVYYRLYDRGLIAVNPAKDERKVTIPIGSNNVEYWDVYFNEPLESKDGGLTIHIPGDTGRVYTIPVEP